MKLRSMTNALASVALVVSVLACSRQPLPNCCDDSGAATPAPTQAAASASAGGASGVQVTEPAWAKQLRGTFAFSKDASAAFVASSGTITLSRSEPSKDGKWWNFVGVLEMKTGEAHGRWTDVKAVTADGFERKGWINGAATLVDVPAAGRKIELRVSIPNEEIRTIEFVNGISLKLEYAAGEWAVARPTLP